MASPKDGHSITGYPRADVDFEDRLAPRLSAQFSSEEVQRSRSLLSPKAVSENMSSRRARDDNSIRREMELLEEKLMRQVLRLQEQSERFMDIMMHPLEAKVAALEGRQPMLDCSIAELRGNLKGLQDSMEMQVRRADQSEARLSRWRKSLEDDVVKLGERGEVPSDVVSRSEMVELAKVLKKELKKLVDEALQDDSSLRQELAALRKELVSVEKVAADAAAQKLRGHQELTSAAESIREEMQSLSQKAIQEEALSKASMGAVQDLEKASEASRKSIEALSQRLAKCEQSQELRQPEGPSQLTQRLAKCEKFDEEFHQALKEQSRRLRKLEDLQSELHDSRRALAPIEASEASHIALVDLSERLAKCEQSNQELQHQLSGHGEQLESQAGTSNKLEELSTHLARCERRIEELRELQEGETQPSEAIDDLSQRLAQCEQMGKDLQSELHDSRRALAPIEASEASHIALVDLSERLAKCEQSNQELQHQLSGHGEQLESQAGTSNKLEELSTHLARCERRIEELRELQEGETQPSEAIDDLSQRLAQCEQMGKDLQSELHDSRRALAPIEASEASHIALEDLSERLAKCEQSNQELQHQLSGHGEQLESQVPGDDLEEGEVYLSDGQLMLLDLQRRVSLLELSGAEEQAPKPVLSQAAELIQSIELDLHRARQAVGDGSGELADLQADHQETSSNEVFGENRVAPIPGAHQLPPLAAMKVMASPRLQRLSMTPRTSAQVQVSSPASETFPNAALKHELSVELRAEVAAVWDAVAELAEIVGDATPASAVRTSGPSLGGVQSVANTALVTAEQCQRSVDSMGGELRDLQGSLQELDSRVYGCERKLKDSQDESEPFATFGMRSFRSAAAAVHSAPCREASSPDTESIAKYALAAAYFVRFQEDHPLRRLWEECRLEAKSHPEPPESWESSESLELLAKGLAAALASGEANKMVEALMEQLPAPPFELEAARREVFEGAKAALGPREIHRLK
ncbi:unnamed protein product [Effrenium voratum]|uniref:Uncharacterized protein n=1 Tax=Effrenium voratum TaxID=2562239 RepID=A0AA36JTP8_9DINO|nr:unnamed protein product [Effrenium voratum]CAJ1425730.1 unnamed protein product [Effrenium voratum]